MRNVRPLAPMTRFALPLAACLSALSTAPPARADSQITVGLTIGAAGVGEPPARQQPLAAPQREFWGGTDFHLGLRSEWLFGRSRNSDFGVGPYVEILTHGFDEVQFGGGASGLIPVIDPFPLVLSFGAYGRKADDGYPVTPGLATQLFWGSRSYNFHGRYVLALGLVGQFRYGFGDNKETSIVVGAQIDVVAFSLPFLFLVNATRGGSRATDPVK
jgi:hypothetical protein